MTPIGRPLPSDSARRPAIRPTTDERRRGENNDDSWAPRLRQRRRPMHKWLGSTPGDLLEHPPGAMEQRCQYQTDRSSGGNRPRSAVREDPGQARWMAGRKQALQKLLSHVDHKQAQRAQQPQPGQRQRVARQRPLARHSPPRCPQEPPDDQRDQQHEPRRERMQIRMPRPLATWHRWHLRRPTSTAAGARGTPPPAAVRPARSPQSGDGASAASVESEIGASHHHARRSERAFRIIAVPADRRSIARDEIQLGPAASSSARSPMGVAGAAVSS